MFGTFDCYTPSPLVVPESNAPAESWYEFSLRLMDKINELEERVEKLEEKIEENS